MRSRLLTAILPFFLASAIAIAMQKRTIQPRSPAPMDEAASFVANNARLAQSDPDTFSWSVFQLISKPEARQPSLPNLPGQKNVVWENWADNDATFPGNTSHPPTWPAASEKSSTRKHLFPNPIVQPSATGNALIEVRRNQQSFTSIVQQQLWNRGGLVCAYKAGTDSTGILARTHLAPGSIEIKAGWEPFDGKHPERYHINYDSSGNAYKLVAIHIMTNALATWTWSTFEQIDEPTCGPNGNCKNTQSASASSKRPSQAIAARLQQQDPSWQFYRLVGTQIASNNPTYLGNSVLERGDVHTSCITCHAGARIYKDSSPSDPFAVPTDANNEPVHEGISPSGSLTPYLGKMPPGGNLRPMGFLWSLIHAQSAFGPTACSATPAGPAVRPTSQKANQAY